MLPLGEPGGASRACSSRCCIVGVALALSAQLYGALHGMNGVQLVDLRPDALPLFVVKQGGLVLSCALLELAGACSCARRSESLAALGGQGQALALATRITGHRAAPDNLIRGARH